MNRRVPRLRFPNSPWSEKAGGRWITIASTTESSSMVDHERRVGAFYVSAEPIDTQPTRGMSLGA